MLSCDTDTAETFLTLGWVNTQAAPRAFPKPEKEKMGYRWLGGAGGTCKRSGETALGIINSSITHHLPTHYQLLCRHPSREELEEEV